MNTLPTAQDAGSEDECSHRGSCNWDVGSLPFCPRCRIRNLAGRGKIFVQIKARCVTRWIESQHAYKVTRKLIQKVTQGTPVRLYKVWQKCVPRKPDEGRRPNKPNRILYPYEDFSETNQPALSIQYFISAILLKKFYFIHTLCHLLGFCSCQDPATIVSSTSSFPLSHSSPTQDPDLFDKFWIHEHNFTKVKSLHTGGETDACMVMKHTQNNRLYVFKTVTKAESLISHKEQGKISNEAYILLHKLQTNLHPHRNIVQVYDAFCCNAIKGLPLHILQMKYCAGGDLLELQLRCSARGAAIPVALAVHIFTHLIHALVYLHCGITVSPTGQRSQAQPSKAWEPILHNDVKPENILLRWPPLTPQTPAYPDILLADFGVAAPSSACFGPRGTYTWTAPEITQAYNLQAQAIQTLKFTLADQISACVFCTTESDIFALGAVMYSLLTSAPFEVYWARSPEKRANDWAALGQRYPAVLVKWIRKCLGIEPFGRPGAVHLLENAVGEFNQAVSERNELPKWVWSEENVRMSIE